MAIIGFLACAVISLFLMVAGFFLMCISSAFGAKGEITVGAVFISLGIFGLYMTISHSPFTVTVTG